MVYGAPLLVRCAEIEPPNARKRDGCGAHRARLQCDIEIEARQTLAFGSGAGSPYGEDLRMRRWIARRNNEIMRAPGDFACGRNNHCADGSLAKSRGVFGFRQG